MNTALELIIDFSLSMGPNDDTYLLPDRNTRMSLAKSALINDIIPILDYAGFIGIRTFYSKEKEPVIETAYEGVFDKNIAISKIQAFTDPVDTGRTPISAALQSSIDFLKKSGDIDKKIILVTDGEETDGGDFITTAENGLKEHGIPYSLYIIGIGLNEKAEAKCKQATVITNGFHVNLLAKNYDKKELATKMRSLTFKAVETSVENLVSKNNADLKRLTSSLPISSSPMQHNSWAPHEVEPIKTILDNYATQFILINKQLSSLNEQLLNITGNNESYTKVSDFEIFTESINDSFKNLQQNITEIKEQHRLANTIFNKANEDQNSYMSNFISSEFSKILTSKLDELKVHMIQQKDGVISAINSSSSKSEKTIVDKMDMLINKRTYEGTILFLLIVCASLLSILLFRNYF